MRSLLLLLLLATPLAQAGESINESRPMNSDALIQFDGVEGEIIVKPGSTDRWQLSGQLASSVREVDISGDKDGWQIDVDYYNNKRNWGGKTKLVLEVPSQAELNIEMVSGDITVHQLLGEQIQIETVSGDIESEAMPNYLEVESVSGDIRLQAGGRMQNQLASVSGDIRARNLKGELEANTVSGKIAIDDAQLRRAQLESVSGDINMNVELAEKSRLSASTNSGDVVLGIPKDLPIQLEVETFSGSINSAWGRVHRNKYGPGESLDFRHNAGTARIELSGFSGDVTVREQ
jgi:DUF4097 and DUF4098 domain-containing protein YvlB